MIKKGKKYKVFNVQKATDKNQKAYYKFSIGDSLLDQKTRQWNTEWWSAMTYSNLDGIKNHDFITIKEISSCSATVKDDKCYRSLFITAERSSEQPVADFTAGESKPNQVKGQATIDDLDELLPF